MQAFRELFAVRLLKSIDCRLYTFPASSSVKPVTAGIPATDNKELNCLNYWGDVRRVWQILLIFANEFLFTLKIVFYEKAILEPF